MAVIKKTDKTSVGEDCGESEPSATAGWNLKGAATL